MRNLLSVYPSQVSAPNRAITDPLLTRKWDHSGCRWWQERLQACGQCRHVARLENQGLGIDLRELHRIESARHAREHHDGNMGGGRLESQPGEKLQRGVAREPEVGHDQTRLTKVE